MILFPRKNSKPKNGDSPAADLAAATQHKGATIMPIEKEEKAIEMVAVTDEMKNFGAYAKLRVERMNARQVGPRIVKAAKEAKDAEEAFAMETALGIAGVAKFVDDKPIKKVIYVPGKILNIIV